MRPSRHSDAAERAARAIAAGEALPPPDAGAADPTMAELLVIAEIARLHRDGLPSPDPLATIGVPPPVSNGRAISRWSHFHLLERLGHGTSGVVYRAWDGHLAREVALKLRAVAPDEPASMIGEARRLGRVRHPHFVTVHGTARIDGQVGTWMELLNGRTLHDLVTANGPFSAQEAALVAVDLCSALAAVHAAGLLHRDVKPANVIRERAGRIVLLDLSASRDASQATADLAGTPPFLAPEVLRGAPATIAADIYSLGATLFFLTTGATPREAAPPGDRGGLEALVPARPIRDVRPDLPPAFVEIVERATADTLADRFASAGALEAALAAFLASRSTAGRRGWLSRRVPAGGVPVGLAALLVIAASIVGSVATRLFLDRAAPGAAPTPVPAVVNPLRVIGTDQLTIARAVEELAATHGERGEWRAAVDRYREAERLYRVNTSADAPLVARAVLNVAWAQHQAGDLEAAAAAYELAIAKLREFNLQPLISAAHTALAGVHQRAGRQEAAALSIGEALEARALTLGLADATDRSGLDRAGLTTGELARAMTEWEIGRDQDGDALPDVLEAAVGLDPRAGDSDGDGIGDGRGDHDQDGLANDLELGLAIDPTGVVAQCGGNDPEWLGFEQPANRRVSGAASVAAGLSGWRVEAFGYSQYFWRLSLAQRTAALTRGWRLSMRGIGGKGRAYANLDLGPDGARFDLDFEDVDGSGLQLQRNTSVVPYLGIRDRISNSADWGLVELDYNAATQTATLLVNGRAVSSEPSRGHQQFREGLGLAFGNLSPPTGAEAGAAEFRLVLLVIR
jgi:tetratricopeptide (TPR) repeat protein